MPTRIIPLDSTYPKRSFRITIDGVSYVFRMRWNNRMERWIISISDSSDTLIVAGLVLNTRTDIAGQFRHLPIPQGLLLILHMKKELFDPDFESLDADAILTYSVVEE